MRNFDRGPSTGTLIIGAILGYVIYLCMVAAFILGVAYGIKVMFF